MQCPDSLFEATPQHEHPGDVFRPRERTRGVVHAGRCASNAIYPRMPFRVDNASASRYRHACWLFITCPARSAGLYCCTTQHPKTECESSDIPWTQINQLSEFGKPATTRLSDPNDTFFRTGIDGIFSHFALFWHWRSSCCGV